MFQGGPPLEPACGESLNCSLNPEEQDNGRGGLWHKPTTESLLEVRTESREGNSLTELYRWAVWTLYISGIILIEKHRHVCGLLHFLVLSGSSPLSRVMHCVFTDFFTHSFIALLTSLFICSFFSFMCLLTFYKFYTWRGQFLTADIEEGGCIAPPCVQSLY